MEILLSETIEDDSLGSAFKINKTNKTASLFGVNKQISQLVIPQSITHKTDEYLITSIVCLSNDSFLYLNKFKKISFEEKSAVKTIYRKSLISDNMETIGCPVIGVASQDLMIILNI